MRIGRKTSRLASPLPQAAGAVDPRSAGCWADHGGLLPFVVYGSSAEAHQGSHIKGESMKRIKLGKEGGAYSAAVVATGTFAFISGQGPLRNGSPVRGSIEEETTVTLNNLLDAVTAAGGNKESIVRCGCYLASIDDFSRFNEAYRSFFGPHLPARTTIGADLFDGIKVEIDAIVALP